MDVDNLRFESARTRVLDEFHEKSGIKGIGTLAEKTLHAVLKLYYEPDSSGHEIKIGPFTADIVGENGIIEIQTRDLRKLRAKLEAFLPLARVTVVYPIARTKYISWVEPATGEVSKRHKSPKTGTYYQAFPELYGIKSLLVHPNLTVRLVLLDMEEYRWLNGWDSVKKRGSSRMERIPVSLSDEMDIACPEDYSLLIPENLPPTFTTRNFSAEAHIPLRNAQTALNVLCHMGVVRKNGKAGRLHCYVKQYNDSN